MAVNVLDALPTPDADDLNLPEDCPICGRWNTVCLGAIFWKSGWHAVLICNACRHVLPTPMDTDDETRLALTAPLPGAKPSEFWR